MWFENLVGFNEIIPEEVRANLKIEGDQLISIANSKSYTYGKLEVLSLAELEDRAKTLDTYQAKIQFSEVVGNIQTFHRNPLNEGAFFQAASQFNLLEMVGPHVTPEEGVDIYEHDFTQGPACAIACGAGTIYRNYFAPVNNQIGQSADNQIDCLKNLGAALGNKDGALWEMSNGYAFASKEGLENISQQISAMSETEYEQLKEKLSIGLQWNTEVTISENKHLVTQAYCSALPVGYSDHSTGLWEDFARLVLNASYEATFYAALLNYEQTGNNNVYLTLVGGGVFGNKPEWIFDAIESAILKFSKTPLNLKFVSYGNSNQKLKAFLESIKH
ncbi:hypothetical protein [Chondrinema litorale]|uniref:hypothetical protein n=1 Tax=Chondrinema litorale TaxID=2994555 RepID=UPI002543F3F0|nr:hypothetical protein [Chondrinema litorale]UZR97005.1 hypothetical protein OQ292_23180 [Chondrinema litorale]